MTTLTAGFSADPVELRAGATEDDLQLVIRAVYKQILGNAHLLSGERLDNAESLLRNKEITVREFVRLVAQSELYRSRFFESNPPYRFIELNCKHLLGRAPLDQQEIANHVQLCIEQGYEAEINSYIDSDYYIQNFGENSVPSPSCVSTQTGVKNNVFNRTISLLGGFASSDATTNQAKLTTSIATNSSQKISLATAKIGISSTTSKIFRIVATKVSTTPITKQTTETYKVGFNRLSQRIQMIQKSGGEILSITEA